MEQLWKNLLGTSETMEEYNHFTFTPGSTEQQFCHEMIIMTASNCCCNAEVQDHEKLTFAPNLNIVTKLIG